MARHARRGRSMWRVTSTVTTRLENWTLTASVGRIMNFAGKSYEKGVPIFTTGSPKSSQYGDPGMPIFTGCANFYDTDSLFFAYASCVNSKPIREGRPEPWTVYILNGDNKDGDHLWTYLFSDESDRGIKPHGNVLDPLPDSRFLYMCWSHWIPISKFWYVKEDG